MKNANKKADRTGTPFFIGDSFELEIQRLAFPDGNGVGRHPEGITVFVPFSAPGDRLVVEITEANPRYLKARIQQILEASKDRVEAPCPVFGTCGGCQLQHLSYESQIHWKQQDLQFAFKRFTTQDVPIHKSPSPWNYRNRIQVQTEKGQLGFTAQGSHRLVPVSQCAIAEPQINQALKQLDASGPRKRVEIQRTPDGEVHLSQSDQHQPGLHRFSQVNSQQNETLKAIASQWSVGEFDEIYDLYCGQGNFSQLFEDRQEQLTGVELSEASTKVAQSLLPNAKFIAMDVAEYLKALDKVADKSLVLLDPPRSGLGPLATRHLRRLKPQRLILISCHPATLKRDLEALSNDFHLQKLEAVDMFPQTGHLELMALLERK